MIRAAFPESSSRSKWLQQSFQKSKVDRNAITKATPLLKAADPLYYNSLIDKHTRSYRTKPEIKKGLLKSGCLAKDGSVCMNKSEKVEVKRAIRMIEEREAKMLQLEAREQERIKRLKQVVSFGEAYYCTPSTDTKMQRGNSNKESSSLDKRLQRTSLCSSGNAAHAQLTSNQVGIKVRYRTY